MFKILLQILVLSCLMYTSSNVLAGEWSGSTSITKIYAHSTNNSDGTIYLGFDVIKNPDNCPNTGLVALKKSNKTSSEIYSMILAAANTNSKVNYYVSGCDVVGYPVLLHITQLF